MSDLRALLPLRRGDTDENREHPGQQTALELRHGEAQSPEPVQHAAGQRQLPHAWLRPGIPIHVAEEQEPMQDIRTNQIVVSVEQVELAKTTRREEDQKANQVDVAAEEAA